MDLRDKWLDQLEDYYRDKYPTIMRIKIKERLPKDMDTLKALFDIVVLRHKAQFGKVPDLAVVIESLQELYEVYPEFNPYSWNALMKKQRELLPEATPEGTYDMREGIHALLDALQHGRNPTRDETLKRILAKYRN